MKKAANINLNSKGFSLIELMIVVAIIGLLAAIGIPQFSKFQARARQSEAKGVLSAIYTAESSFLSEWACYSSDLRNIGAGTTGVNLRYIAGFDAAITANPAAGCNTGVPPHGGTDYNYTDGNGNAAALGFISPGATWASNLTAATVRTSVAAVDVAPTASVFTAAASGDPKNMVTTTNLDVWTMNQAKQLSNTAIGIQ